MYGDICSRLTEPQYVEAKNDRKPDIYNPKDGALIADDVRSLLTTMLMPLWPQPKKRSPCEKRRKKNFMRHIGEGA